MQLLNAISAIFALLAAGLWFWSSTVKLPTKFTDVWDAPPPEAEELLKGLRAQSIRSALGAACAAVAAVFQAVVFLAAL